MTCADCPDLDNDAERPADPNWKPRPRCCLDEHIDRRVVGDPREFEGAEKARALSERDAATGRTPPPAVYAGPSKRQRKRKR